MNRKINKVAVLGSGVMGSRIACHFANIGIELQHEKMLLIICIHLVLYAVLASDAEAIGIFANNGI